jgi:drug/metabolite transporter (DMT)-like permease
MRPDQTQRWAAAAGYTAALLSGVMMGLTWPLQKYILDQKLVGAAGLNWLNMIGMGLVVWPVYLLRFRRSLFPPGAPYRWLVLFACIAGTIFYSRNVGVGITGATTAAVVARSEVAFVFVLSYLVLHQPVSFWGWAGSALLLLGALRVGGVGSEALAFSALGFTAVLISAVGIAFNALIIKLHFGRIPNELAILASATVQTVIFSVLVPATGGLHGVRQVLAEPRVLGLVALGSVIIPMNLFAYYYAMKRAPMWSVRILALTGPPVSALADYFILRAPVTAAHLQGLAAVLVGAPLVILSAGAAGNKAAASEPAAKTMTTGADGDGR